MPQQTTPSRIAFLFLLASSAAALRLHAQAYTPPPPPLTTQPCKPTKKDPCTDPVTPPPPASTVDKFAFPGDSPDAPASPDPNVKPTPANHSSSDPFPFPTDDSKAAPGSSSSSSSGNGLAASPTNGKKAVDDDDDDAAPAPPQRRKLAKVEDLEEREAKDIQVSRFYMDTGNFLGAYNRAKDAIRLFPDDAEAHFALASAAQKLRKNDEATAEFKAYLKLEPDGDHVKLAERALDEIH